MRPVNFKIVLQGFSNGETVKIIYKLLSGFFILAIFAGIEGVASFNQLKSIELRLKQVRESSMLEWETASNMLVALKKSQLAGFRYAKIWLSDESQDFINSESNLAKNDITNSFVEFEELLDTLIKATNVAVELGRDFDDDTMEEDEKGELEEILYPLSDSFDIYKQEMEEFIRLTEKEEAFALNHLVKLTEGEVYEQMRMLIYEALNDARAELDEEVTDLLHDQIRYAKFQSIFLSILTFFSSILLGFLLARNISKPIKALKDAAYKVGKGQLDFQVEVYSADEIGVLTRNFNNMVKNLKQTTISKEYLDDIIELLPQPLIIVEPDLAIRKVNAAACKLGKYELDELIGIPINAVIRSDESELSTFDQLLLINTIENIELIYVSSQGEQIPVLFSASVLDTKYGGNQIICVAHDITEIKRHKAALTEANELLEERVTKRTKDLLLATESLQKELTEHKHTSDALHQSREHLQHLSYSVLRAQEDERMRLAKELHDGLGQSLSLLKVQLSALKRKLHFEQTEAIGDIEAMRRYLNEVIVDTRRLSQDLTPSILLDIGLSAAIRKMCKDMEENYSISIALESDSIENCFPQEEQIMIYRIFQEIFTNIVKHAEAREVKITISKDNQEVVISVKDDGRGFDTSQETAIGKKGMGLSSIQERSRMINASFTFWSQPGKGTCLTFHIPLYGGVGE